MQTVSLPSLHPPRAEKQIWCSIDKNRRPLHLFPGFFRICSAFLLLICSSGPSNSLPSCALRPRRTKPLTSAKWHALSNPLPLRSPHAVSQLQLGNRKTHPDRLGGPHSIRRCRFVFDLSTLLGQPDWKLIRNFYQLPFRKP